MLPGETLTIRNSVIYRISTDEEHVQVQKDSIIFDMPLSSLGLLNI